MVISKNIGKTDSILRFLMSGVIASLIYLKFITGILAIIGIVVGLSLFLTALFRWCPPYTLFGLNTNNK